jgi:hypothetical protein
MNPYQMQQMNKEQQRIAIAAACGWVESQHGKWSNNGLILPDPLNPPDYLNDLNAMHEAIMSLTLEDQCNMTEILRKDVLKFTAPTITATAAQHAEAFLKTLNLWTND